MKLNFDWHNDGSYHQYCVNCFAEAVSRVYEDDKFLFFERLIYPFALTVPAGHVDAGEDLLESAKREAFEEVGITAESLIHIAGDDIIGDSCRRGSDAHKWHAYMLILDTSPHIEVKEEGEKPVWVTLNEVLQKDITLPVRYIINNYTAELTR